MRIVVCRDKMDMGEQAAQQAAAAIRGAIAQAGEACIVVATGMSQFEMLEHLVAAPDVDWGRVTAFHLDEYVGLPLSHPASFRKYLQQRFIDKLPRPLLAFHAINGEGSEGDEQRECERLGSLIGPRNICLALVGIGENGHLAFNDPPANFEAEQPFLVVDLDQACRQQQLGEGWFESFEEVPRQAISMSIRQIMKARRIVCSVPDSRKAEAVRKCLQGPVTPLAPASILQQHENATIYLDPASAALLQDAPEDAPVPVEQA